MPQKPVRITTDSTVDLTSELVKKYNIIVCPLCIEMDAKSYRDTLDIKPDDIYEYYDKTGSTARSSACNVDEYGTVFRSLVDEGYDVVHIGLSSEISSSYNNARIAAQEYENVYTVDSKNLSTGIGLLVIKAAELAMCGTPAQKIAQHISSLVPKVNTSFILDTLDYLHAGGRCSAIVKFGANLLKLKPSIIVTNGEMTVDKKYRGSIHDRRLDYIANRLENGEGVDKTRIFFTHSGLPQEEIDCAVEKIKSITSFGEVLVTRAGCVISAHCGPGCCGVLFINE